MKIFLPVITLFIFLVGCNHTDEIERIVEDVEPEYNFISKSSIKVNGETFTMYCYERKDGIPILANVGEEYIDDNGTKYRYTLSNKCMVYYINTMYDGFDLLKKNMITVEELKRLGYHFEVYPSVYG